MAADAISDGRKRGLAIYGETCPQYLVCSEDDYDRPDFAGANYVMSPPLRPKWNQSVLLRKLKNFELQMFGSDHCSFNNCGQKELGPRTISRRFPTARRRSKTVSRSSGTSATTPASSASTTSFRWRRRIAAKLFGLFPRKGTIAVGSDADVVIWDPAVERTISATSHHMNVDNNIFEGLHVKGKARHVFSRGRKIVEDARFTGVAGAGASSRRRFAPCSYDSVRRPGRTIGLIQTHHETHGAEPVEVHKQRRDRQARRL